MYKEYKTCFKRYSGNNQSWNQKKRQSTDILETLPCNMDPGLSKFFFVILPQPILLAHFHSFVTPYWPKELWSTGDSLVSTHGPDSGRILVPSFASCILYSLGYPYFDMTYILKPSSQFISIDFRPCHSQMNTGYP